MNKILEFPFFPLFVVVILIIIYWASNVAFIQCNISFFPCTKIDSNLISEIENAINLNPVVENSNVNGNSNTNSSQVNSVLNAKKQVLTNQAKLVNAKEQEIEKTQELIDKKTKEINDLVFANTNSANVSNANASNANTSVTNTKAANFDDVNTAKTKLEDLLKEKQEELKALSNSKDKAEIAVSDARAQISSRYSKRMTWIFLTGIFFFLCIASLIVSISVISEFVTDRNLRILWLVLTTLVAIGFGVFTFLSVYRERESNYMSVVLPMFTKSIAANGDVSINAINFFNAFNFGVTFFLVIASCSILYAIRKTEKAKQRLIEEIAKADAKKVELLEKVAEIDAEKVRLITELELVKTQITDFTKKLAASADETEKEKLTEELEKFKEEETNLSLELARLEVDKPKLERDLVKIEEEKTTFAAQLTALGNVALNQYEDSKKRIRIILYIGALMLFVGMMRVKLLADWHLLFISNITTNPFYKLLSEYFDSSVAVQAGFYSIVLAAIYLPVAYVIATKTNTGAATADDTSKSWWWSSITTILPRALTIISPFLAKPIVDLFNFLTGQTT